MFGFCRFPHNLRTIFEGFDGFGMFPNETEHR